MRLVTQENRGFTLVEIMVVAIIIGILVLIAVPRVVNTVNNSRYSRAESDLNIIAAAIGQLTSDTGVFPSVPETNVIVRYMNEDCTMNDPVEDLSTSDAGLLRCNTNRFDPNGTGKWKGPYLDRLPVDPWDTPYFFSPCYNVGPSNATASAGAVRKGGGKGQAQWKRAVVGSYGANREGLNSCDSDDIYIIVK